MKNAATRVGEFIETLAHNSWALIIILLLAVPAISAGGAKAADNTNTKLTAPEQVMAGVIAVKIRNGTFVPAANLDDFTFKYTDQSDGTVTTIDSIPAGMNRACLKDHKMRVRTGRFDFEVNIGDAPALFMLLHNCPPPAPKIKSPDTQLPRTEVPTWPNVGHRRQA